ncbi:hypothetical protein HDF08_001473 [Edaphobacter lichenicola]|uniref:Uncharacterized protein n=1 Tax=Tunturiibacter lichenicola TaxID=2051959 RepID=A0A852VIS4_9BACT|nr:hypothetical protein [Edaphobacter lichenicola]
MSWNLSSISSQVPDVEKCVRKMTQEGQNTDSFQLTVRTY